MLLSNVLQRSQQFGFRQVFQLSCWFTCIFRFVMLWSLREGDWTTAGAFLALAEASASAVNFNFHFLSRKLESRQSLNILPFGFMLFCFGVQAIIILSEAHVNKNINFIMPLSYSLVLQTLCLPAMHNLARLQRSLGFAIVASDHKQTWLTFVAALRQKFRHTPTKLVDELEQQLKKAQITSNQNRKCSYRSNRHFLTLMFWLNLLSSLTSVFLIVGVAISLSITSASTLTFSTLLWERAIAAGISVVMGLEVTKNALMTYQQWKSIKLCPGRTRKEIAGVGLHLDLLRFLRARDLQVKKAMKRLSVVSSATENVLPPDLSNIVDMYLTTPWQLRDTTVPPTPELEGLLVRWESPFRPVLVRPSSQYLQYPDVTVQIEGSEWSARDAIEVEQWLKEGMALPRSAVLVLSN